MKSPPFSPRRAYVSPLQSSVQHRITPLSSPTKSPHNVGMGKKQRALSSRIQKNNSGNLISSSTSWPSIIFGMSCILAIVLVSIQMTTIRIQEVGDGITRSGQHPEHKYQREQSQTVTVESQKKQFLKGGNSGSTKRVEAAVERLKKDHSKEISNLKEQISNLQQQLQQQKEAQPKQQMNQHPQNQHQKGNNNNGFNVASKKMSSSTTKFGNDGAGSNDSILDLSTAALRDQNGYTSPVCTVQLDDIDDDDEDVPVFDSIYFLHMRKAGGSSLRSYFEDVRDKYNVTVMFAEGRKSPELPINKNKKKADYNDGDKKKARTLFVSHIREPVARAISHYKYEHRWLCKEQLKQPGFVPSNDNVNMNLTTFITDPHLMRPQSKIYWECASDCHAKWFSGYHPNTVVAHHTTTIYNSTSGTYTNITKNTFEYAEDYNEQAYMEGLEVRAREAAFNYHLIVVSEWLHDDAYKKSIERLFGIPGLGRREWMICRVPTKKANADVPLQVTEDEMDILKKNNEIDSRLRNDLLKCGNDGNGKPQFASRKPFKFVPSSRST